MYKYFMFILLLNFPLFSQWDNITKEPKSMDLNDIVSFDKEVILSVSDYGWLKYSTDSGSNWLVLKVDYLSRSLNSIDVAKDNAFIVGDNGLSLRSKYPFTKWENFLSGINADLRDIAFWGENGIIIGDSGFVASTNDFGISWKVVDVKINGSLIKNDLCKVAYNKDGSIVISGSKGLIIYSLDNGVSFNQYDILSNENFVSLDANDNGNFLVGSDSGKLLHIKSDFSEHHYIESKNSPHGFYTLKTIQDSIIIASVLYNLNVKQVISFDYGKNWSYSKSDLYFQGISFDRITNYLYLCSTSGFIFRVNPLKDLKDESFNYLGEIIEQGSKDIQFHRINGDYHSKLISFSSQGIYVADSKIQKWEKIYTLTNAEYVFTDVIFNKSGNIIAIIDSQLYSNGRYYHFPKIIVLDANHNVKVVYSATQDINITKLVLKPDLNLILAPNNKMILYSIDDGSNFDSLIIPNSKFIKNNSLNATNDGIVYCVNYDSTKQYNIIKTRDLKNFETHKINSTTNIVYFLNKDLGINLEYVLNDEQRILITKDGGNSFNKALSYPINNSKGVLTDIAFVNENAGIVAGYDGVVFFTSDSGQNWQKIENLKTSSSLSVYFPNDKELYVCDGYNIFKYLLKFPTTNSIRLYNNKNPYLLFPNPASSTTTIKLTEELNGKITAVDLLGNETPLWSGFAPAGDLELDVSHLPAGIYTILINNGYKTEALKMIKE